MLAELGIELIGATVDVIARAEDRELFKHAVESCGLQVADSRDRHRRLAGSTALATPAVVRPAFTLGGHGGGFVATPTELRRQVERGLAESPIGQVLVEESLRGWDEFELEVVRDRADNVVIVCSIENLDPMGVHTGDSVTVAPQMTLSDEAYQELRDAAIAIVRAVGVDTGGSNIQFARERDSGELRVIEMNPRVSRSSALASKATGYPIAKVAAKLAVGYTLDEIPNDLTGTTPASFEPTLDYVVVKFPRFAFEKFPGADRTLGTQMKSVGESMGIGRTFVEAFVKARRGLEIEPDWQPEGLHPVVRRRARARRCRVTGPGRLPPRRLVRRRGRGRLELLLLDPRRARRVPARARPLGRDPRQRPEPDRPGDRVRLLLRPRRPELPRAGLRGGDGQLQPGDRLDRLRHLRPALLRAARRGGRARRARARAAGRRLHPVRRPDAAEARPGDRARRLPDPRHAVRRGRPGRGPRALRAPRRARSASAARTGGSPSTADEAAAIAARIGYPVLVRPSYVLGGRAMRVCYDEPDVRAAMAAVEGAVLVDRFLENAVELDVDALCDGTDTYVAAVMEHVEEAGIHSGDSSCVLPAPSDSPEIRDAVRRLGPALGVVGLLNVQLAILGGEVYVLEVNPRASRTVPFASKAIGVNLVDAACRLAAGATLAELDLPPEESCCAGLPRQGGGAAVRALPRRRPGARARDALDRRGDGERRRLRDRVRQGRARRRPRAAARRAGVPLRPRRRQGRRAAGRAGARRARLRARRDRGHRRPRSSWPEIAVERVEKGDAVVDLVRGRGVDLVVNTPQGRNARRDGYAIREAAVIARVPCITTLAVARAAVEAIANARAEEAVSLQERHDALAEPEAWLAAS